MEYVLIRKFDLNWLIKTFNWVSSFKIKLTNTLKLKNWYTVAEQLFRQCLVLQSSNKKHPSNRIDHSNNISKGQDKRISNLEVRAGQSFGLEKTL